MATLLLRASGPLPADEAWERYAQPACWPTWSPQLVRVETSSARIRAGLTGRVWTFAPVPLPFRVLAVDEAQRRWSWRVRVGPVPVTLVHGVEPRPRGGSRTWLRVSGPLPVVLAYAPLARLALHRLLR